MMMLVGNSDGREQKAIPWLHGDCSKWCFYIYARNSSELVGGAYRGIQACLRHPLSHYIIYWQIPLFACCQQEQDTASWCCMHAYCLVNTWTHIVQWFLLIICMGSHSWNVHCFLVWWHRKYEDISPPHVEDFCYITDNSYTKEEVWSISFFVVLCHFFSFWCSSFLLCSLYLSFLLIKREGK